MYALFHNGRKISRKYISLADLWEIESCHDIALYTKENMILKEGYTIEEVKSHPPEKQ
jgi:hypothetical protein